MSNLTSNPPALSQTHESNLNDNTNSSSHACVSNGNLNGNGYQPYPTAYEDISSAYSMAPNYTQGVAGNSIPNLVTSSSLNKDNAVNDEAAANCAKAKDTQVTFPQRLLHVLCEEQSIDIISWLPHGRSFIVYDKKKFVESILPRFFKESKFTSFTRKLNRWGFTRISRGVETGAYHHEFFRRDDQNLCLKMKCQKKHEKKISDLAHNPKKASAVQMRVKQKKEIVKEFTSTTTTSPPPLAYQISSSTLSSSPHDDVPPLKNNTPSKSNLYMKLQNQQREIEQRLQKAVQDASQQHKPRHLFPNSFLQAQQNMFPTQPSQLSQHNMGPTSAPGMGNGMLPLIPQPMSTQSMLPQNIPSQSLPIQPLQPQVMPIQSMQPQVMPIQSMQPRAMPIQSMQPQTMPSDSIRQPSMPHYAQAGMPNPYLPTPGIYGEKNETMLSASPYSQAHPYASTAIPSMASINRIGKVGHRQAAPHEQVTSNTVQPYMGTNISYNTKYNYADSEDNNDDNDDEISNSDSV